MTILDVDDGCETTLRLHRRLAAASDAVIWLHDSAGDDAIQDRFISNDVFRSE
ncbi:hypothetical protein AAHK20_26335 [Trinickia sp. YCB016]